MRSAPRIARVLCALALLAALPAWAAPKGKPAPAPAKVDNAPPVVEHAPMTTVFAGQVITVEAKMVDKDGIFEPKLFVRAVGRRGYTPFSFEKSRDDLFKVEVPPGIAAGGAFSYYVECFDAAGNGPTRVGTPEKPLEVIALPPPPVPVNVTIRAEPEDAEVVIDGQPAGKAPQKKELMPGAHVVVVKAPGRRALEQRLSLVSGRDVEVLVALRPEGGTGKFRVTTEPKGARLFVDGTPAGETPYEIKGLKGKRHLRVELRGHVPEEREVVLEEGRDAEVAFALRAMPEEPALVVESTPPEASVLIDGRERGKTPWIGVVPAGEHELVLKGADGRELATTFLMGDRHDVLLRLNLPEPRADGAALLAVLSEPLGANLFLAGAAVGRTPFLGPLPSGEVELKLELEGYEPLTKKVMFDAKRDRELSFTLARAAGPAHLVLTARPAGAELVMDGLKVGKGPATLQVDPGEHEISASLAGRRTVAQRVRVDAGQRLAVSLDLPAADPANTTPMMVVESRPAGAIVKVDGKEIGKTPLSRTAIAPGKHQLELVLAAHETWKSTFEVPNQPGYELRLAAGLAAVRGMNERAVASVRDVVDAQLARGIECFSKKEWACTADAFRRAHELEPDPDYLYQVALALSFQEKWKEAAQAARTVSEKAKSEKLRKDAGALAKRCEERAAGKSAPAAAAADTAQPVLAHQPLDLAYRQRPLRLLATMTDESGVFLPRACWRNVLSDGYECADMKASGAADTFTAEVPGSAVIQGFSYFLESYDLNGNGPARSGTPEQPHLVSLEDPPADSDAFLALESGELEPAGDSGTLAWASLGVGAAAGVGALVALALSYSATRGDVVTNGVHSMSQRDAASARTLDNVSLGLAAVSVVGIGAGLVLLPPAGAGGDAFVAGAQLRGEF